MQNKLCSKGEDKSISIEYFLEVVIQTPFLFMDDFIIFEPSTSYKVIPKKPPQISVSGLVLLDIRLNLKKFNRIRLQKAGYFVNLFLEEEYFKFDKWKYGPYSHSIDIVARNIKEYQDYYGIDNSRMTFEQIYQVICSEKVDNKFNKLHIAVKKSTEYINVIQTDKKLEGIATVLYLVQDGMPKNREQLIESFKSWSEDKANRFSDKYISECINYLEDTSIISPDICGNYELTRNSLLRDYEEIEEAPTPSEPSHPSEPSQPSTPSQPEATVEEPEPDTLNVTVGNIKTQSYTGKGITPKIMVKDPVTRKKLKQGKHYTVSYENNVNAGTAVILIRGIEANGYSGVKHVYFTIQSQTVAKKIRAKVNGKKFLYTGSELTPGVNLTYNKTISGYHGDLCRQDPCRRPGLYCKISQCRETGL